MNYIASLFSTFCVSAIVIGALHILCPNGVIKKSVKYILGLCFILSVLTASGLAVKKADFDFSFKTESVYDNEELLAANVRFTFSYALIKEGIDFSEIIVCTDKNEKNSIVINKVIIKSVCEKEKILSVLKEPAQNYEVEIINE